MISSTTTITTTIPVRRTTQTWISVCHLLNATFGLLTGITDLPDRFTSQLGVLWCLNVWSFQERANHIFFLGTFQGRDICWIHVVLPGQFLILKFSDLELSAFRFRVILAVPNFSHWVGHRYIHSPSRQSHVHPRRALPQLLCKMLTSSANLTNYSRCFHTSRPNCRSSHTN